MLTLKDSIEPSKRNSLIIMPMNCCIRTSSTRGSLITLSFTIPRGFIMLSKTRCHRWDLCYHWNNQQIYFLICRGSPKVGCVIHILENNTKKCFAYLVENMFSDDKDVFS